MALSSFQLFLSQAQNAPGELKVQVLRIIMDLLIMYDQEFFGRSADNVSFRVPEPMRPSSSDFFAGYEDPRFLTADSRGGRIRRSAGGHRHRVL